MADVLGSLLWMIVTIGLLVTFHEFGHYWVARRCGVRVLRFSVGFGRPLWSRRDRHGTEFAIAAIPLGGYVRMLDEREGDVPAAQLAGAFNRKPVGQRIAIVAAGPAANLLLCVLLLWGMFVVGRPDYSATLGQVQGMAAQAGLQPGDRIAAIDGREVRTWMDALQLLTVAAIDRHDPRLRLVDAQGRESERRLPLSTLPAGFDQETVARQAGLAWRHQMAPAVISGTRPDSPAHGLAVAGDVITAIDGQRIEYFSQIGPLVQALGERGGTAMVEVDRNGERLALEMAPARQRDDEGRSYWALGLEPPTQLPAAPHDALQRFGPLEALPAAVRETGSEMVGSGRRPLWWRTNLRDN